jgi:putative nucleotidyltransferase with HDIG domain
LKIEIDKKIVTDLKVWFSSYVKTFKHGDKSFQENIILKEKHTMQVCKEILNIGRSLGLNGNELRLAEIIALFHDLGRFEQYARYKTFLDRQSEDHAELGIKILKRYNVLSEFDNSTKNLISRTIRYHNRALLPQNETEHCLFFTKLLRDADKLDIWRVVTDYYHCNKDNGRNRAIELGLPDTPGISKKVYQNLMNKKTVSINYVNNLNDFKLLQMSWVFDINFYSTFHSVQSRHYLEMIRDVLPGTDKIQEVFNVTRHHIDHPPIEGEKEIKTN